MRTVDDICEALRQVRESGDVGHLKATLEAADKRTAKLFHSLTANDVFAIRDARKLAQQRLNRLEAANERAAAR